MTEPVLLLTKTGFHDPRDGGSLRVAAVVRELQRHVGPVRAVAIEEVDGPAEAGRVGALPLLWANLRVLWQFARIGSLSAARWYRPRVVRELVAARGTVNPRVSVIEYSQLLGYRPVFRGRVVLDMHNIESELMANYSTSSSRIKACVARYEAWRLRHLESHIGRYADAVAVVSDHDRDVLQGLLHESVAVVVAPNGVGDDGFDLDLVRDDVVVFVGHLGWAPNVDAAVWLCESVWPRVATRAPQARLKLVGRSPAKRVQNLRGETVEVHADVPSVLPHVASAKVATAPLLAAGGTRLKILEALSCGTPVVATPLGALGLAHLAGRGLDIHEGAAAFADAIVTRLSMPSEPAVPREASELFRWPSALEQLVSVVAGHA